MGTHTVLVGSQTGAATCQLPLREVELGADWEGLIEHLLSPPELHPREVTCSAVNHGHLHPLHFPLRDLGLVKVGD